MDENELLLYMGILSDYCASHEGSCRGCMFYTEVKFLNKKKGNCYLTGNVPENWVKDDD